VLGVQVGGMCDCVGDEPVLGSGCVGGKLSACEDRGRGEHLGKGVGM